MSRSAPRVGVLCGQYAPDRDGVSAYTKRLVSALAVAGVDATVVTDGAERDGDGDGSAGSGWRLRDLPRLRARLRRSDVDLLHVQFAPSAYGYQPGVGLVPELAGGRPVVATLHEYGWWAWRPRWVPSRLAGPLLAAVERRGWWDRETLRLTRAADALVTTNEGHAEVLRSRFGSALPPTTTVPIGTNVEAPPATGRERAEVRAALGAPPDAPLLVFFGFVHPVKGIPYLLEATADLARRHPDLRLALVGGFESLALRGVEAASYRREVDERVRAAGLAGRVEVTGYVEPAVVSAHLRAADVAVLPFNAGLTTKSGSLLAAMAHGAPVVGAVADPPDPALVDGRHALLVEPRRPELLAAAVARVLADPALAARLADEGAALVRERSWGSICAALLDIYAAAMARGTVAA